jgi:ribulose-phosphate 3-epimerase
MEIVPAILESEAAGIQAKLDQLAAAAPDVQLVQLDVTDGTITEQVSWHQPSEMFQLKWSGEFELHLMQVEPPIREWLADSRVRRCVVHAESSNPIQSLQAIRAAGRRAGLALNPATSAQQAAEAIEIADYILLMTVTPGAQGQLFQYAALDKIHHLLSLKPGVPVYVDGGVNDETIKAIRDAGCSGAAVGSFLWKQTNLAAAISNLRGN